MEWMTATEASERWGLAESTIRVAIRRGQFDDQIERGLVRKSGKIWLLTDVAMTEVYGPEKKSKKVEKKKKALTRFRYMGIMKIVTETLQ